MGKTSGLEAQEKKLLAELEEGGDQEAPVEDPDPDAQDDSRGNQEVEALRTLLAEERMIQRGQKAM